MPLCIDAFFKNVRRRSRRCTYYPKQFRKHAMPTLKNIWDHPYTFWTLLSIPAIPMLIGLSSGDPKTIHQLLHPSGEFAARFMIITMMITPLVMWLKGWRGPRWLMKRRRYLGVATFGYALLHTLFYLLDLGTLALSGNEISKLYIWTGWLAFFIFVPLAITIGRPCTIGAALVLRSCTSCRSFCLRATASGQT
jgi:hypothetical protein